MSDAKEDVHGSGFRGFAAATSAAAGGFNYEFRVSVPGYGVDNGLTTCLRPILNLHPKERQRGTVTLLFIHILKLRFFWAVKFQYAYLNIQPFNFVGLLDRRHGDLFR